LAAMGEAISMEDKTVATLLRMGPSDAFTEALSLCQEMKIPAVLNALLKCARDHPSDGVTCAALVYYHAGLADEPFDWSHRPFFLRFNAGDPGDRQAAFEELCAKLGKDPATLT